MKTLALYGLLLLVAVGVLMTAPKRVEVPPTPADSVVMIYDKLGHGSGVIVDVNCVLTAAHVADHNDVVIQTADGDVYGVDHVVSDPDSDLALLYIDGEFDETPLLFDPTPLEVGDEITLIGTPWDRELMNCVLPGFVVKVDLDTELEDSLYVDLDVIDCAGAPGCSGGPLVDKYGHIRGIVIGGYPQLPLAIPVSELDL